MFDSFIDVELISVNTSVGNNDEFLENIKYKNEMLEPLKVTGSDVMNQI